MAKSPFHSFPPFSFFPFPLFLQFDSNKSRGYDKNEIALICAKFPADRYTSKVTSRRPNRVFIRSSKRPANVQY